MPNSTSQILRIAFLFALCVVTSAAAARASGEFCPADISNVWTSSGSATSPSSTYGFIVEGHSPRSGTATIVADTSQGWFTFSFAPVEFKKSFHVFESNDYKAPYDIFATTVYVHFPQSLTLKHAWVQSATLTGERTYGWNDNVDYKCEMPGLFTQTIDVTAPAFADDATQTNQVSAQADPEPPIVSTDCKLPFVDSVLVEWPRVIYQPFSGALSHGMTLVAVALNDNSTVRETWVLAQSGNPEFDSAATAAAKRAKFISAVSYCGHASTIELMPFIF